MNIHKPWKQVWPTNLGEKSSHGMPPPDVGCGIGPSSPHDQKVPSATVRLGNGSSLSRVRRGWRAVFLEMNKKCRIFFSSIYMIVKKYYTWDLIISKCYYILLWFSVVIIIIITVIIIIKIIDDSKNWGIHQQHWYFQSPIQFEGSFVLVFSPRQESPKTWGKDAGLVVLEPPWKNRVHQLGSPLSRADNFSKHHLDFLLVFPSIHGKFNADLLFYASNQW